MEDAGQSSPGTVWGLGRSHQCIWGAETRASLRGSDQGPDIVPRSHTQVPPRYTQIEVCFTNLLGGCQINPVDNQDELHRQPQWSYFWSWALQLLFSWQTCVQLYPLGWGSQKNLLQQLLFSLLLSLVPFYSFQITQPQVSVWWHWSPLQSVFMWLIIIFHCPSLPHCKSHWTHSCFCHCPFLRTEPAHCRHKSVWWSTKAEWRTDAWVMDKSVDCGHETLVFMFRPLWEGQHVWGRRLTLGYRTYFVTENSLSKFFLFKICLCTTLGIGRIVHAFVLRQKRLLVLPVFGVLPWAGSIREWGPVGNISWRVTGLETHSTFTQIAPQFRFAAFANGLSHAARSPVVM